MAKFQIRRAIKFQVNGPDKPASNLAVGDFVELDREKDEAKIIELSQAGDIAPQPLEEGTELSALSGGKPKLKK